MTIEIKNLTKSYKKNKVLDNLSLEIKEGSLFGLLGPNGAGKTTLVSIMNYLQTSDSGEIDIFGYDYQKDKKQIKQISSYVPQTYAFYPNLTAYENLEFFGALYGLKNSELRKRIEYCVEVTSLEKFLDKRAHTYSGGVKRRLNIAIGLLNNPKILYLDEPTVGIDPQSRKYILDVIKRINQEDKTTIIYTSHYMEEIEYLCDDIAILDNHKIILHEKKELLLEKNSFVTIKTDTEDIQVNVKDDYNNLIETLALLKNRNTPIENIVFNNKNLEELFLNLTKGNLRD
ncbi:MAG: ABC transporter ATP-binding protein [Arcobacteraceae bacterium]|nr:ABC transporter ATP-binding protein [Arcobacteraceae bacterium]